MARVQYKGKIQRTMAQYEALTSLEQYADYDIIDHPDTYITNAQMTYALACVRLFPAGDTYICSDTGTYTQGHIYKIKVDGSTKSWEDITANSQTVDETYSISEAQWQALSGNDPYKFMVSVTAEYTIGTKTEVGIINDQPALFANYGFVVGSVSNQTVIIFAVNKPTADINLSVRFRE